MRIGRPASQLRFAAGALIVVAGVATAVLGWPVRADDSRPSRVGHNGTASEAALPGSARAPGGRAITIGHSVHGRPIEAFLLGGQDAARTVLIVGCIHGNEAAGIAVARRLEREGGPPGANLWVVPDLNPDGVAARRRQNADGVDLNRNFPWHWRRFGSRGDPQYSGPRPLSEPESGAVRRLILQIRPQITIWFHQPLGLVDLSGGDAGIERRYARLVGLAARRLTRYRGSVVSWSNTVLPGTTSFVVELPPGSLSAAAVARYTRAAIALARSPVSP